MTSHVPLKAFVTDGDHRPALAVVRALGRRGVSVIVGGERHASLASSSRYCSRHVTYPSPYHDREAFERFVIDFVAREGIDVVLPVTDVTTHSVCLNQDVLSRHCAIAVPPYEAFDFVTNKWKLLQRAAQCGLSIPRTHFVDGLSGLRSLVRQIEYPAVVKPIRSRIPTDRAWLPASVHYAYAEHELLRLYQDTDYLATYPSLIQERIDGPGVGLFVLFDRGELLAAFSHRRLREKPPSGGASVFCESISVDARLRDDAVRLLGPLKWHGVAMMEYKQDRRTGSLFLMEVNGRFWGSLQLAIDAGIDFPHLTYELALGRQAAVSAPYEIGAKSRWLLGDLDHLVLRLFKSDRELQLPESAPSKWQALLAFLKFAEPGLRYELPRSDDPRPFLHELHQYAATLSRSVSRRVRRRRQPVAATNPRDQRSAAREVITG